MSVDAGDVVLDAIVEVDPALMDSMVICVGIDPELLNQDIPGYDEPQPADMPTDPQLNGDPALFELGPVAYDDPQPADMPTDPQLNGDPVDPMPEWRTLDGDAGSDTFPVLYMQMDAGNTGDAPSVTDPGAQIPGEVIYTLADDSGLVFAETSPDVPGRSPNPLPYERTSSIPAFASEPEIDRTPVHYAVSEPFYTGLDLL